MSASGLIRAVGTTGGVITSAGLIFAASMFGLVFGSIATMVQTGFIIGDRAAVRHLRGAHHHGAGHGRAGRPGKLVAVAVGAASDAAGSPVERAGTVRTRQDTPVGIRLTKTGRIVAATGQTRRHNSNRKVDRKLPTTQLDHEPARSRTNSACYLMG